MRRRRCPAHALGAPDPREPLRGSLSVRLRLRLYDRTVPIARPQRLRREGLHGHLFPCLHRGSLCSAIAAVFWAWVSELLGGYVLMFGLSIVAMVTCLFLGFSALGQKGRLEAASE